MTTRQDHRYELAVIHGVLSLSDLLQAFDESQTRLISGLSRMSYEEMCQPSGYQANTIGDSLGYFHFHEAHHVGQLLYLAQSAGKAGVWLGRARPNPHNYCFIGITRSYG